MRLTLMNASDIIRDGLGVELVDESNQTIAEVFRSDSTQTVVVNTFGNDIPLDAMEELLSYARKYIEPFEGGQPLSSAVNFGTITKKGS
jgi:hypothetical protein